MVERMKPHRVWFYRPSWYWHGWSTLLPIYRGHDEFARWTVVLGWTITGRVVIALRRCGDAECEADRRDSLMDMDENALGVTYDTVEDFLASLP